MYFFGLESKIALEIEYSKNQYEGKEIYFSTLFAIKLTKYAFSILTINLEKIQFNDILCCNLGFKIQFLFLNYK